MLKNSVAPALLVLAVSAGLATAHGFKAGAISIGHPFAYATPPSASNGAAYLKLANEGSVEDVLLMASGVIADRIEIHQTSLVEGVIKMRPVPEGVAIPAKGQVDFTEGSFHLMLIGLRQPLKEGDRVPLRLAFRDAGDVQIELAIEAPKASSPDPHAGH